MSGIEAFAHGAYDDAANNLDGLVEQLPRIGGSHAQREVFEDTILESRTSGRGGSTRRSRCWIRGCGGGRRCGMSCGWVGRLRGWRRIRGVMRGRGAPGGVPCPALFMGLYSSVDKRKTANYAEAMIVSFRHRGLRDLYRGRTTRRVAPSHVRRLNRDTDGVRPERLNTRNGRTWIQIP